MRVISFTPEAFRQYNEWRDENPKIQDRIIDLLKSIQRNPFDGIGKPEPLKHNYKGFWSRRINDEHRLVYKVTDDNVYYIVN